VLIDLFTLPRTWGPISQAANALLEGTPTNVNLKVVEEAI
jgi:Co/Zn/Cd efflux system component